MTYISDTSNLQGFDVPISLSTLSQPVLSGFNQVPRSPGSLVNFQFSTSWGQDNRAAYSGGASNYIPMLPPLNIYNPIATNFNVDLPGSGASSPGVDSVAVSNTTVGGHQWLSVNSATGDVTFNGTNFESAVNSLLPALGNKFTSTTADDGTAQTAGSTSDSIVLNGDSTYTETDGSSSAIQVKFIRNLFESFSDGSTTLSPTTQNQSFTIKKKSSATNVTVETNGAATIEIGEAVAPLSFSTVTSGDGSTSATALNQSFGIKNGETSGVLSQVLLTSADGSDIDINLSPAGHAGFGAQMVEITDNTNFDPPISSDQVGTYAQYTVMAFTWTGNGTSNANITETSNQTLRDYSYSFPQDDIESQISSEGTVQLTHIAWPVGTRLLAQRVAASTYVTGTMPILKVTCP